MTEYDDFNNEWRNFLEILIRKMNEHKSNPDKLEEIRKTVEKVRDVLSHLRDTFNTEMGKYLRRRDIILHHGQRDTAKKWLSYISDLERYSHSLINEMNKEIQKLREELKKGEKLPEKIKKAEKEGVPSETTVEAAHVAEEGKPKEKAREEGQIEEEIEKKKERPITERLTKDQLSNIAIVHSTFVLKMKGIFDNMQSVRDIASLSNQTPEENKLVGIALKFQRYYSVDLKPALQTLGSFINTIGEVGIAGYNRMTIIKGLPHLLNEIENAYNNIKNARKRISEKMHIEVKKEEEEKTKEPVEEDKNISERLKKLEGLRSDFLILKRDYEKDVAPQITRWSNILGPKMSKK